MHQIYACSWEGELKLHQKFCTKCYRITTLRLGCTEKFATRKFKPGNYFVAWNITFSFVENMFRYVQILLCIKSLHSVTRTYNHNQYCFWNMNVNYIFVLITLARKWCHLLHNIVYIFLSIDLFKDHMLVCTNKSRAFEIVPKDLRELRMKYNLFLKQLQEVRYLASIFQTLRSKRRMLHKGHISPSSFERRARSSVVTLQPREGAARLRLTLHHEPQLVALSSMSHYQE